MTSLLQLFKMESTSDSRYKQSAVKEFLVAAKGTVQNIQTWLSNVYGNDAVDRSTAGHWAKRARDREVGKLQLLDVLHQSEMWESWCFQTVKEWLSLMWSRQEWQLTQMCISACRQKWGSVSNKFGLTRSCMKCCFSMITQGLTPMSRLGKPSHNRTDGVTAYILQPRLSTFRFSPLPTPERCHLWKEVGVGW